MDTLQHYLFTNKTTETDWLNYYKNTWIKNSIAITIDVQNDTTLKAIDPEQKVMKYDAETGQPTGEYIPVKERLELRKISLQDALDILRAIQELEKTASAEFEAKHWSKEALAVAPDMIPKVEEEPATPVPTPGDPATTEAPASNDAQV